MLYLRQKKKSFSQAYARNKQIEIKIMNKLLLILSFLTVNLSLSQFRQAKITFNDSTSIEGFGEIKNNKIYFKIEQTDKAEEWSSDITKGLTFFGYGYSEKFEYIKIDKEPTPQLVELIEEGHVNLYRDTYIDNHFWENLASSGSINPLLPYNTFHKATIENSYFVKRDSEDVATNISSSFAKRALTYFADCGGLMQKIKSKKFTKNNIEDLVAYYNDYCGKENDNEE